MCSPSRHSHSQSQQNILCNIVRDSLGNQGQSTCPAECHKYRGNMLAFSSVKCHGGKESSHPLTEEINKKKFKMHYNKIQLSAKLKNKLSNGKVIAKEQHCAMYSFKQRTYNDQQRELCPQNQMQCCSASKENNSTPNHAYKEERKRKSCVLVTSACRAGSLSIYSGCN